MKILGLDIRRVERKESLTAGPIVFVQGGREVIHTPRDFYALSKAGYENCMSAYACIRVIARSVAGIPWTAYLTIGEDEIDEQPNGRLMTLWKRPNPLEGAARFHEKVISYLLLHGNSYVERVGPSTGPNAGVPLELYAPRPDRITIIKGDSVTPVRGFRYSVGGDKVDWPASEVLHLKTFHPTDDWYGLSPLAVAATGVDIANAAQTWNLRLLQNDMRPPGAFIVKGRLTDKARDLLRADIKDRYMGAANAGEPLLLESGGGQGDVDFKPFTFTPKEMEWLNSSKVNKRDVCSVFGVPPEIIGDAEQKTYSNYQEARRALYHETVLPLADWYRDEFNWWLAPLFGKGVYLDYDRDEIEALQEDRNSLYTRLANAWWLTPNQKLVACGFAESDEPGADRIWIPMSMVLMSESAPAARSGAGESEEGSESGSAEKTPQNASQTGFRGVSEGKPRPTTGPTGSRGAGNGNPVVTSTAAGFWGQPERKAALGRNFEKRVRAKERPLFSQVRAYFHEEGKTLLRRIEKIDRVAGLRPSTIFDVRDETRLFIKKFYPRYEYLFRHAGVAGVHATKGQLYEFEEEKGGIEGFTFTEELEATLKKMVMESGLLINTDTLNLLTSLIAEADIAEATVKELATEIWRRFSDEFGASNSGSAYNRALKIARTETAKVENAGQLSGYKENEYVDRKGWLCAFVELSREAHIAADHEYSKTPILLDEPFIVAGEALMYPGDSAGSAGNIINCLCTTFPVVSAAA